MAYTPYATTDDFFQLLPEQIGDDISQETLLTRLRIASRHIDTLTFNRIIGAGGLEHLTEFQQEVVKEVVCRQALFELENEDMISSVLSGYSINGVSVSFGETWNVKVQAGVAMPRDVYALLEQTGLCWRGVVG